MDKPRNRTDRAVPDVRRRTRDRPRRRDAAKNRGENVRDSLPHQFRVRAMPRSRHAVRNDRGKQGFDRSENRDRERRLKDLSHHFQADVRQMRRREPRRDLVLRPDRHHAVRIVPPKNLDESGGKDNRYQGTRNLCRHFRPEDADEERKRPHDDRVEIRRSDRPGVQGNLPDGVRGFGNARRKMQSQKVRHLPERDDNRDARGEADRHRKRDELDDRAELRDAEDDKHDARHERRRRKPVVAVS